MLRFSYLSIYACWTLFVAFILASSLPFNPISFMDYKSEMTLKSFIPEGWGFFTRSPKEADVIIYQKKNGRWIKNEKTPLAQAANLMGIDRRPRAQATEMAMLLQKLKPTDWLPCKESFIRCLSETDGNLIVLKSTVPNALLKDTICFINRKPLPWAWHDLTTVEQLPSSYVKLVIQ